MGLILFVGPKYVSDAAGVSQNSSAYTCDSQACPKALKNVPTIQPSQDISIYPLVN